jgi:hypothetical protein
MVVDVDVAIVVGVAKSGAGTDNSCSTSPKSVRQNGHSACFTSQCMIHSE